MSMSCINCDYDLYSIYEYSLNNKKVVLKDNKSVRIIDSRIESVPLEPNITYFKVEIICPHCGAICIFEDGDR